MEHLHKPDSFLREAHRILRPNGKIICLVPDWESNYKTYFDDFTHRTPFTKPSLEDILKITDFEDVEVYKFRQLPIVWKFPILNLFCALISPFIPVRVNNKFLRWSNKQTVKSVFHPSPPIGILKRVLHCDWKVSARLHILAINWKYLRPLKSTKKL